MKIRKLIIFYLILFSLTACNLFDSSIESITIQGDQVIDINEELQFHIETKPKKNDLEIVWSTSDPNIATVNNLGIVKGVSKGKTTITAVLKDNPEIKATINLEVIEAVIESIAVNYTTDLYIGESLTLIHTVYPIHASQDVEYLSSNPEIASIDQDGNILGLSLGQTNIIVKSTIDQNIYKEFTIYVKDAPITEITIEGSNELEIYSEMFLEAEANNHNITNFVFWSSNNENIATVDNVGRVVGLNEGTVIIKAISITNNLIFAEHTITIIKPTYKYYQTKVLLIDKSNDYIELLNCPATNYDNETNITKLDGNVESVGSINDLYLGMENIYVKVHVRTNRITDIVIDGETGFSNIRVAIRNSITDISRNETLYHNQIVFRLNNDVNLQTYDGMNKYFLEKESEITISILNSHMVIDDDGSQIFSTNKRIIFIPTEDEAIQFASITRGSSEIYSGNMEVSINNEKLLVVNDINLEKYLYKVVPSEMPSSYNVEALKAQAIAARTYAYKDIYNRTTENLGYTVDDSTKSQVYNNINQQIRTNQAVNETKGLVMMNNNDLVNAFYYSTSSGLTASSHEVWITDAFNYPLVNPYLIGQNLTKDANGNSILFDYQNEENMLSLFKTINLTTPDNFSNYHRWKVSFTKSQLTNSININLKLMYSTSPNLILTETEFGWKSLPIPSTIGQVNNVYVSERGESGVVMSLVIETTSGKYKIVNQYNIRFTIRPRDGGTTVYFTNATGNYVSTTNNSILFSGYFAIETDSTSFTFYGGGNGHGVGMSQNGANGLANNYNYKYNEILATYYSNIDLIDVSYNFSPRNDYRYYLD